MSDTGSPASGPFRNILETLRIRDYAYFAAGNAFSLIGTWMQRIAAGWLIWDMTQSATWLGLLAVADLAPTIVVSPFAGAMADRWNRLRLIRVTQCFALAQAVALFFLSMAGILTAPLLVGLTLYLGITQAMMHPARLAVVAQLVPRSHLSTAVAINSSIFNTARLIGPALAGVLILMADVTAVFAANGLTFILLLLALSRVTPPPEEPRGTDGFLRTIVEGFAEAVRTPAVGLIYLQFGVTSFLLRPVAELLPGFADGIFDLGAGGLSAMTSTMAVGAILAGISLAVRRGTTGMTRLVFIGMLVMSLANLVLAISSSAIISFAALACAGYATVATGVGMQTILQMGTPSRLRGRVLSTHGIILTCGTATGALLFGATADAFGLRWPVAVGALIALAATLWFRRHHPAMQAYAVASDGPPVAA